VVQIVIQKKKDKDNEIYLVGTVIEVRFVSLLLYENTSYF
jgi:hypothetical protein